MTAIVRLAEEGIEVTRRLRVYNHGTVQRRDPHEAEARVAEAKYGERASAAA